MRKIKVYSILTRTGTAKPTLAGQHIAIMSFDPSKMTGSACDFYRDPAPQSGGDMPGYQKGFECPQEPFCR